MAALLEEDLLVLLDLALDLREHLGEFGLISGKFINDEVVVVNFAAVFGAKLSVFLLFELLQLVSGAFVVAPALGRVAFLLLILFLDEIFLEDKLVLLEVLLYLRVIFHWRQLLNKSN
jgi:hypothetical protein